MKLNEISYKKLTKQIETFLKKMYNRSGKTYGNASPYGQILEVDKALFDLDMVYINAALKQTDIFSSDSNNKRIVRTLAVLGHYIPARARCAEGALELKLKAGVSVTDDIAGGLVRIFDKTLIKNNSNNLYYSVNLGTPDILYNVSNSNTIYLPVKQGQWETQPFTGTGEASQTLSVQIDPQVDIDENNYTLSVNTEVYQKRLHLYDMLKGEKSFYARTGLDSGVDIIFGNENYGTIPPLGSEILFSYLKTNGSTGNIPNAKENDFMFIEESLDGNGESIILSELFDINVVTPINYGSDGDSIEFIKSILPLISENKVLSKEEHYKFFFKRLGIFSIVEAYRENSSDVNSIQKLLDLLKQNTDIFNTVVNTKNNDVSLRNMVRSNMVEIQSVKSMLSSLTNSDTIYLFLIPDVVNYYASSTDVDYFTLPLDLFEIDDTEKIRLINLIKESGTQSMSSSFSIVSPKIKKYVLNIVARLYEGANEESVRTEMKHKISDYMLNLKRRDRIPPSDFIALLEGITSVDSVDVNFLSEETEKYHLDYEFLRTSYLNNIGREPAENEVKMSDGKNYDPYKIFGLDATLGDIVFAKDELPVIRGGWADRNLNSYSEDINVKGYTSMNVMFIPERSKKNI